MSPNAEPSTVLTTLAIALGLSVATGALAQDRKTIDIAFGAEPETFQMAVHGPESVPSPAYAFRAARVLPVTSPPIEDAVVLTRGSKIVALGPRREVGIPEDYEVVDCDELWCVPGLVDLHCHIASASSDINDMQHQTNPEMRTLDLVTMDHENLRNALAGGITTVMYIPGSGSNVGGFGTLTKTWGRSPQEALLRFPGCVKIAQGNNPVRRSGDLGALHLGMNANIRFLLRDSQRYHQAWVDFERGEGPKPELEPDLEYMRGLFRHEYPACVHSQYYQVLQETLRLLRDEFDLWTVIVHGTFDAYRLSEETLRRGVPVCNGPRQYHFDQAQSKFIGLAEAWRAGGEHGWREPVRGLGVDGIGINTDSPVVAQEQLALQCAMAVRLGLPDEVGLRAITINPATFVGIDHRVGSLEVGKDADFVFWTGDPLDPRNRVEMVVVNGNIAYRRSEARPRF